MGVKTSHYDRESGKSHSTLEHIGLVVDIGSSYIGDGDSHYWAVVFDPQSGEFTNVGLGYTSYDAKVDAPKDLQSLYDRIKAAKAELALANYAMATWLRYEREAEERLEWVTKGSVVKVVKGRKVPKGTVGTVKVNCEGQWGRRVLLALADGTEVWTAEDNVEVLPKVTVENSPEARLSAAGWDDAAALLTGASS
jgi:hypothetical protein